MLAVLFLFNIYSAAENALQKMNDLSQAFILFFIFLHGIFFVLYDFDDVMACCYLIPVNNHNLKIRS